MNKEEILREIRRTAEANGGLPLGSRRFETETGIKDTEWLGKLWARWSDALREAGFAPNQLRVAYESVDVLEKYATLARELGRLPTANDMRLKDRRDPTFPTLRVFDRFGTKERLVQQVAEFCRGRDGFEAVAKMCEQYVPSKRVHVATGAVESEGEIGFVYLVKSGRFYKIGMSNAAGRREYEIAIQLPEKAKTVHLIRTDDPRGIEAYWHKRFEAKRKNGEWFDLSAAEVAIFKRRKFM